MIHARLFEISSNVRLTELSNHGCQITTMSGNKHPVTSRHTPDQRRSELHCCESLTTRKCHLCFDIGCRNTEGVLQGNNSYTCTVQSEVTVHYYYSCSILRTRNGTNESRSQLTVNCTNTELLPNSKNENTAPKRFSSSFNLQPNRHDCLDADLASDVHCIRRHVKKGGFISD